MCDFAGFLSEIFWEKRAKRKEETLPSARRTSEARKALSSEATGRKVKQRDGCRKLTAYVYNVHVKNQERRFRST